MGADDVDVVRVGRAGLDADDVVVRLAAVGERVQAGVEAEVLEVVQDIVARGIVLGTEAPVVARVRVEQVLVEVRVAVLADA